MQSVHSFRRKLLMESTETRRAAVDQKFNKDQAFDIEINNSNCWVKNSERIREKNWVSAAKASSYRVIESDSQNIHCLRSTSLDTGCCSILILSILIFSYEKYPYFLEFYKDSFATFFLFANNKYILYITFIQHPASASTIFLRKKCIMFMNEAKRVDNKYEKWKKGQETQRIR